MWSVSEGVMHVRVPHQSRCGLYQRTNQIACQKIRWYLHYSRDVSDYCSLFSQTFYGLLFSYLTITNVTSYVHHQLPVSFLLYIATKKTCQIHQIITVNSSTNAPISKTYSSHKITLACLACLCLSQHVVCCNICSIVEQ